MELFAFWGSALADATAIPTIAAAEPFKTSLLVKSLPMSVQEPV
jgi:hypothetical protein